MGCAVYTGILADLIRLFFFFFFFSPSKNFFFFFFFFPNLMPLQNLNLYKKFLQNHCGNFTKKDDTIIHFFITYILYKKKEQNLLKIGQNSPLFLEISPFLADFCHVFTIFFFEKNIAIFSYLMSLTS